MDEQIRSDLARRAAPYGLALLPETHTHEYTDPQNETAVQQRWQPICEQHGAAILGVRDVPTQPVLLQLDGVRWLLGPLGNAERDVPAEVFHRWRALEAADVPFFYWLWGEEQPARPTFRPFTEYQTGRLISVPRPDIGSGDPLVIGVIPTAPNRGLWVLLGRWFH